MRVRASAAETVVEDAVADRAGEERPARAVGVDVVGVHGARATGDAAAEGVETPVDAWQSGWIALCIAVRRRGDGERKDRSALARAGARTRRAADGLVGDEAAVGHDHGPAAHEQR